MEKFLEPTIETRESGEQEQAAEVGNRALEKEVDLKIPLHRRRGFMLATFLAMGMTLFAGQAEARGRNIGRRIVREEVTNSIAAARNGVDMAHNQKILEVNAWHLAEVEKITAAEGELWNIHQQKKQELKANKDKTGLAQLEAWYQQERMNLKLERERLRREREMRLAGVRVRNELIKGGIGILRSVARNRL